MQPYHVLRYIISVYDNVSIPIGAIFEFLGELPKPENSTNFLLLDGEILLSQNVCSNHFTEINCTTPNLSGKVVIGEGLGPGLTNRVFNSFGGESQVYLNTSQIPSHSHELLYANSSAFSNAPSSSSCLVNTANIYNVNNNTNIKDTSNFGF